MASSWDRAEEVCSWAQSFPHSHRFSSSGWGGGEAICRFCMEPILLSLGFLFGERGGGGLDLLVTRFCPHRLPSATGGSMVILASSTLHRVSLAEEGGFLGPTLFSKINLEGGGCRGGKGAEAEFLDERRKPDKILIVFLLATHSHLFNFALRFLFIQTHATSYVFLQFSYCPL